MAGKAQHVMRCHYEVMEVDKDATADELKTKYRKLALKWHPDKNTDNIDEATQRFKEITAAYTTLSDPTERAWYDSHREQILRGGTGLGGDGGDGEDGCGINLFPYFSSSSYTGYGDDDEGFYSVYQALFDEIEELEIQEDDSASLAPRMGGASTIWTDGPGQFYSYWENFSTRRSFGWCDKYNPNDAPNRQVKRAIEKENQKDRNKGKRAFNETVRRLAAWAKKRDPRQMVHQQRQAEEASLKAQAEIKKAAEMRRLREEARGRDQGEDIEIDESLDDMYMEMELMQQFKGKKGKKLREQLLAQEAELKAMQEAEKRRQKGNEEAIEEEDEDEESGEEEEDEDEDEEFEEEKDQESVLQQLAKARAKKAKKQRGPVVVECSEGSDDGGDDDVYGDGSDDDDGDHMYDYIYGGDDAKLALSVETCCNMHHSEEEDPDSEEEEEGDSVLAQLAKARAKKAAKQKSKGRGLAFVLQESSEEEEEEEEKKKKEEEIAIAEENAALNESASKSYEGDETDELISQLTEMGFSESRCRQALRECKGDLDAALGYLASLGDDDEKKVVFEGDVKRREAVEEPEAEVKKLTGKKAKEARKAAAQAKQASTGGGGGGGGGGDGDSQMCNVCKAEFPSRSKLFTHIKETGHALYDPSNPASTPKQMKGKKKR